MEDKPALVGVTVAKANKVRATGSGGDGGGGVAMLMMLMMLMMTMMTVMTVMTVTTVTAAVAQRMIEPHQTCFNKAVLNCESGPLPILAKT